MSKIQLQVGKRYVRRDKKITGRLLENKNSHRVDYPFFDPSWNHSYTGHGEIAIDLSGCVEDLMSEVPEPQEGFEDLTEADHKAIDDYAAQGAESQSFDNQVDDVLAMVGAMLKSKNKAYGNSALDPIRVFSKADPVEQLNVRIDDKLSRIMRGTESGEDTELDLIGYLVIRRIAKGGDK